MGLTYKKESQLRQMPRIESRLFRSKDGKFVVHKTTITDIKPASFYEKVLEDDAPTIEVQEELVA